MTIGLLFLAVGLALAYVVTMRLWGTRSSDSDQPSVRKVRPALGGLTKPFAWAIPVTNDGRTKLKTELVQAGYYDERTLENFLSIRNLALMLWCVFIAFLISLGWIDGFGWKFYAAATGIAVLIYGLPRVILSSSANSRAQAIQNDLPDALDMMTMMISGGLTMEKSLQRVIGEFESTHPALATELAIVARQSEAGSFNDALVAFSKRLALPDVSTLTTLMRQSNRLGGKVVDALREYADTMRRTRHQKAEELGNKASLKLLLPVILCLAPPIYILLLGPAVLELRDFVSRENKPGGVLTPNVEDQRQSFTAISPQASLNR